MKPFKKLWRKKLDVFEGLTNHCSPGLHEYISKLVAKYVDKNKPILDLGTSNGSFLRRLQVNGYTDLSGGAIDTKSIFIEGIKKHDIDLDYNFAESIGEEFSLVTLIEVIEHLENPRHTIDEIFKLLPEGGHIIVSTPNIAFWKGRLLFLLTGEIWGFRKHNYNEMRHITALSRTQLLILLRERGFKIIESNTAGSFSGPLQKILIFPMMLFFSLMKDSSFGECLIVLAKKESLVNKDKRIGLMNY